MRFATVEEYINAKMVNELSSHLKSFDRSDKSIYKQQASIERPRPLFLAYVLLVVVLIIRLGFYEIDSQEKGIQTCPKSTITFYKDLGGHAYCENMILTRRGRRGIGGSFVFHFDKFGKTEMKNALIFIGKQFDYPLKNSEIFEATPDLRSIPYFALTNNHIENWNVDFTLKKTCSNTHVYSGLTWFIFDNFALGHYHHIMENLLGLWSLTKEFCQDCKVERIAFMVDDIPNFTFAKELYSSVLGSMPQFVFVSEIQKHFAEGKDVHFESIITSDRFRVNNKLAMKLQKMNGGHGEIIRKHIGSLRAALLHNLNISYPSAKKEQWVDHSSAPIKLLVIDRNETVDPTKYHAGRDFSAQIKTELVDRLKRVSVSKSISTSTGSTAVPPATPYTISLNGTRHSKPLFTVKVVILQNLSFRDQVEAMATSDSVVALHGNGLTHILWLAIRRNGQEFLGEVFSNPSDRISYDYQLQSYLSGLRHFGFSVKSGLVKGLEGVPENVVDTTWLDMVMGRKQGFKFVRIGSQHDAMSMDVRGFVDRVVAAAICQSQSKFPPW